MRTTVDLNDELLRRAKRKAADEGIPLRELIERALRGLLENRRRPAERYHLRWRSESGRLQPGVPIDDRSALFDYMDRE